jgi:hypothetical protein
MNPPPLVHAQESAGSHKPPISSPAAYGQDIGGSAALPRRLLVQHVYFGGREVDSLTALQAHGEAPYLAPFAVFGKVDNLPVFSTVEFALHGGRRGAYPDSPT